MRSILPILCAALLATCAPAFDRPAFLAGFVGQPDTEVVRRLGVPSRTYEADGHRFLAYAEHRSEILSTGTGFGGFDQFGGFGYFGPGFGFSSAEVIDRTCETTFEVVNGRVANWSLRGNAC